MSIEQLETLKYSVDAFNDAFRSALETESPNIQKISDMMSEAIDHLICAEEYLAIYNKYINDIDRDEYGYKFDCAIRDTTECFESIQATMRTNTLCDKLRMALTGMCLMLRADLSQFTQTSELVY